MASSIVMMIPWGNGAEREHKKKKTRSLYGNGGSPDSKKKTIKNRRKSRHPPVEMKSKERRKEQLKKKDLERNVLVCVFIVLHLTRRYVSIEEPHCIRCPINRSE